MLPQLDISHYTSQIFWLFVSLSGFIWFLRTRIIRRMDAILANRQKINDEYKIEITELEADKKELQNQEHALKLEIALESKRLLENVTKTSLARMNEELIKIIHDNNNKRSQLSDEYLDYIHNNNSWIKETEKLSRYATDKLKNIGSL